MAHGSLAERRRSDRRALLWSLAVAAALHGAGLILHAGFRGAVLRMLDPDDDAGLEAAVPVDIHFGPPTILDREGIPSPERRERVLETNRLVQLPLACHPVIRESPAPMHGSVRLTVDRAGRAASLGLIESAGFPCGDTVLARLAGDLWYRWLPSERFPAPVDLSQPLTVSVTTR